MQMHNLVWTNCLLTGGILLRWQAKYLPSALFIVGLPHTGKSIYMCYLQGTGWCKSLDHHKGNELGAVVLSQAIQDKLGWGIGLEELLAH